MIHVPGFRVERTHPAYKALKAAATDGVLDKAMALFLIAAGAEAQVGPALLPKDFSLINKAEGFVTITGANLRYVCVSDLFCERLGYEQWEMLGRYPWEFMTPESADLTERGMVEDLLWINPRRDFRTSKGEIVNLRKLAFFKMNSQPRRHLVQWLDYQNGDIMKSNGELVAQPPAIPM